MKTTLARTAIHLTITPPEMAAYLEELLWTLAGLESIMYQLDTAENVSGLHVIGHSACLREDIQALLQSHGLLGQVTLQDSREVQEEDWAESWKRYWHVSRVLPHLVIQPSWEAFAPLPGDLVLRLDPGSAFGTGTHETTQLMLFLLWDMLKEDSGRFRSLLDVGTGSGILAMAAAKQGVSQCLAMDNDPQAVAVAETNIQENGLAASIQCTTQPMSEISEQRFDLVLANILASVIQDLLPDLKRGLAPNGLLLLSGIIRRQLPQMRMALQSHGLVLHRVLQKGEWLALVCQHKP